MPGCTRQRSRPYTLPTLRDPDWLVYWRQEVDGLLMGGYERDPAPWTASATSFDDVPAAGPAAERPSHGGYEIVDKFARKEIFIQGALAERFKEGVQALIDQDPSEEAMDAYIEGFASLMQQPLVLH